MYELDSTCTIAYAICECDKMVSFTGTKGINCPAQQNNVPLQIIFSKSIMELPESWKDAHITPIHKKG